jgi:hypothetical protein
MRCLSIFFLYLFIGFAANGQSDSSLPARLAQAQLDAYNSRNIEQFLEPYADSVSVFMFPNQLMFKGKAIMRQQYAAMFQQTPDLHCTLVKRMVAGNKVVDEESVVFRKDQSPLHAIAIYTIAGGKIVSVHFIQ